MDGSSTLVELYSSPMQFDASRALCFTDAVLHRCSSTLVELYASPISSTLVELYASPMQFDASRALFFSTNAVRR